MGLSRSYVLACRVTPLALTMPSCRKEFGNCDIQTVRESLGHADVSTTMEYTRVLNRSPLGVRGPVDCL
jgi:hypothetical protein